VQRKAGGQFFHLLYYLNASGTLRYNLDPFNEHTDVELWSSLEMVQLKQFISEHGGLDYVVEEGGQNVRQ